MIKVSKLNETIDELENQVRYVKSVKEVYQKIEKLILNIEGNKEKAEESAKELASIINTLAEGIVSYEEQLEEMKKAVEKTDDFIHEKTIEITKHNMEVNRSLIENYDKFENEFISKFQKVSSENKKLYLELENIFNSKIDRVKSDLEVEIRNIKSSMEDKLTDLNSKVINIDKEQRDFIKKDEEYKIELNQKFKYQKILLAVIIGISLINTLLYFS